MKKSISIFQSHEEAIHALEELKAGGVDMNNVSLIGKAEIIDDQIHVKSNKGLIAAPVVAGTVLGTTLGVMTGIGLFAIPGLGVLFGAGAIVGALAGFEVGVATGGLTTILVGLGVKEDHVTFEEHVKEGNFLLMIDGTEQEIARAELIIEGKHLGISLH
jgi:uncharacterized membrane protein